MRPIFTFISNTKIALYTGDDVDKVTKIYPTHIGYRKKNLFFIYENLQI